MYVTVYVLFIVCVTLPPGISPIAVIYLKRFEILRFIQLFLSSCKVYLLSSCKTVVDYELRTEHRGTNVACQLLLFTCMSGKRDRDVKPHDLQSTLFLCACCKLVGDDRWLVRFGLSSQLAQALKDGDICFEVLTHVTTDYLVMS
jgi:hypothetical protein